MVIGITMIFTIIGILVYLKNCIDGVLYMQFKYSSDVHVQYKDATNIII